MKEADGKNSLFVILLVAKLGKSDQIAGRAVKTCKKFEFSIDILSP